MEPANENAVNPVIIAILIALITLVFYLIYKRVKKIKRVVLITGLCDSGKTLLFSRLLHNKFINTQTSIKENCGEYVVNGTSVKLVDIPGHERLRDKFFDEYKGLSRGIIYVLDSQSFVTNIRDIAEFFYNILTDPIIMGSKMNILVLCNKQDLPKVKGAPLIRNQLEKELNTLRVTKGQGQVDSVDPKSRRSVLMGDSNQQFTFAALSGLKVEFLESFSCAVDEPSDSNIADVRMWLLKIA